MDKWTALPGLTTYPQAYLLLATTTRIQTAGVVQFCSAHVVRNLSALDRVGIQVGAVGEARQMHLEQRRGGGLKQSECRFSFLQGRDNTTCKNKNLWHLKGDNGGGGGKGWGKGGKE